MVSLMTCKLCHKSRTLVKAHIYPEAFVRELHDPAHRGLPTLIASDNCQDRPKRSQIGVYDKNILCSECESRLGKLDTYAAKFLIQGLDEACQPIEGGDTPLGYFVTEYDYALLKLFFLSVLWRASVSTHDFFAAVSTGAHEEALRQAIQELDPGDSDFYSVILLRVIASPDRFGETYTIAAPFQLRHAGILFWRLSLGPVHVDVKCDKRRLSRPLRDAMLTPQPPALLLHYKYEGSAFEQAVTKIMGLHADRIERMFPTDPGNTDA